MEHPDVDGPPLTDEMVRRAERELGVTLPSGYVALMRACNGGYTHDAALATAQPTGWAPDHVAVDAILGNPAVDERGPFGSGCGILQSGYMRREWGLPDGLVLLDGDGHWWIALDYRSSGPAGPPSVVWIDLELDDDLQLAESFEAFLAGLVPASAFR